MTDVTRAIRRRSSSHGSELSDGLHAGPPTSDYDNIDGDDDDDDEFEPGMSQSSHAPSCSK